MKEIKLLTDEMIEELCGAKKYAKCYQKYKDIKPTWGKKYYDMANDEIKHAMFLHDMVIDLISAQEEEPPEYMKEIWAEKHDAYIEKMANIKTILAL